MTTQEKNELLKEFVGVEKRRKVIAELRVDMDVYVYKDINVTSKDLQFHWNARWLLPVWYKFRELRFGKEKNHVMHKKYVKNVVDAFKRNQFTDLYDALVNAVHWYNSIKQK